MSELKSFIVLYDGKFIRAYKESEADKVFAAKDKVIVHQKYKRCMAKAKWCRRNRLHASVCGPVEKIDFWEKWFKRWMKLAEKFKDKEAK